MSASVDADVEREEGSEVIALEMNQSFLFLARGAGVIRASDDCPEEPATGGEASGAGEGVVMGASQPCGWVAGALDDRGNDRYQLLS